MARQAQTRRDCEARRVAREILRLLEQDATEHRGEFCPHEWVRIHEKAVNLAARHIQIKSPEQEEWDYLEWWLLQWGKQIF